MAKLELRLSAKSQPVTGYHEIMIRMYHGKSFDQYAKSGIYVNPDYFEYYVNREKTRRDFGYDVPAKVTTATSAEAEKYGWVLRNSGMLTVSNRRIETDEVKLHKECSKKLDKLCAHISDAFENADKDSIPSDWLKMVIDEYNHPEKYGKSERTFWELAEEYIENPHGDKTTKIVETHARVYRVLCRAVSRYERFVREMDNERMDFVFDINKVKKEDIEELVDYLRNEKALSDRYPTLFKRLCSEYPTEYLYPQKRNRDIEERGENTIIKMKQHLKAMFNYFNEKGYTVNKPFEGIKIGTAKLGTPIYITIEERNRIANADLASIWESMPKDERQKARMTIKTLIEQRDIFTFHCFAGCRVGDLMKFTPSHIDGDILEYIPSKTKDESAVIARVPLHEKAMALVEKYKGADANGRLFPFISEQRYNDAIKVIFKMAGVTRNVERINSLTGKTELVPIYEIASSHMARRTFVGNLYFRVQDPALIGQMSGHVEGSKAFSRYRKIEDETLRAQINLIG